MRTSSALRRPLFLFAFLLTTCASIGSAPRLDTVRLRSSLEAAPWSPLFEDVALKIVDIPEYPLRIFIVRVPSPSTKEWVITTGPVSSEPWIDASTVRAFAQRYDLDLAINASYFQKRVQDDKVRPLGLWVVEGRRLNPSHPTFSAFGQLQSGELLILGPESAPESLRWAVGGGVRILENGRVTTQDTSIHPRTALGLTPSGDILFLVVIDGRQDHSRGLSLVDLAEIFRSLGTADAINLDGGGSSTLAARGSDGRIQVLNSPWDHRLYGGERAVATHLGLRARSRS